MDAEIYQAEPLEAIRHSMFIRAERWWWVALTCVVLGVAASTLLTKPVLPSGSVLESFVLVISVAAPAFAALARYRSGTFAARGDLCRRAFLYRDTLGEELNIEEQRIVALWPANVPLNRVTTEQPYFSTSKDIGPGRLAEAVGESAFYTSELAKVMAASGLLLFGASALLLFAAISAMATLSLDAATLGQLKTAIGIVAIVMLTLITAEVLTTALAYGALSTESHEIARSASQFGALKEQSAVTAVRLSEAYSIALAANLPIPNLIYRWHHDRIDRAYRKGLMK